MIDQNLTVKKAGPTSSSATEYSDALDLGSTYGPGNLAGQLQLKLEIPTITGLGSAKTTTFTIQDSADNSSFADVSAYPPVVVTGDGTSGPAVDTYFEWTQALRRYIRVKAVTVSSAGTITAYYYYLKVVLGRQPGV